MYILKNAFKSVGRSIGRNILIGVIVAVIALAACIGLSIREAAENAKEEALDGINITAQISLDMKSMMGDMMGEGGFDRDNFKDKFSDVSGLSAEELETYSKAEAVSDFYYTLTLSINGSDNIEPVSNTEENEDSSDMKRPQMPDMSGMGGFGSSSDFTLIGYSSDEAMTGFINGTATISDGECFEEQTEAYECIIPTELATYNELSVGDSITLVNPNNDEESYTFKILGTFDNTDGGSNAFGMRGSFGANDPTNQIYTSAAALDKLIAASEKLANENDDGESTDLSATASGTYVFSDVAAYESFEEQARALGLSEDYSISSSDINSFEQSLVPLESLGTIAKYFLIVVLIIGAVILVVFNLFNIRERKYEVGVLTAIGMKKHKVALQFMCEVLVVTFIAVIVGGAIGAVSSVPVTNALLENQVASSQSSTEQREQAFGRPQMPDMSGMPSMDMPEDMPQGDGGKGFMSGMFGDFREQATEYITEVNSATNLNVLLKLLGLAVLLTIVASGVSVIFIMRYDPLKILANRD